MRTWASAQSRAYNSCAPPSVTTADEAGKQLHAFWYEVEALYHGSLWLAEADAQLLAGRLEVHKLTNLFLSSRERVATAACLRTAALRIFCLWCPSEVLWGRCEALSNSVHC